MSDSSFQPQEYLRFDLSHGQISTPDEQRQLVIPADLIQAAGDTNSLHEAAYRWGEEQGRSLASLIGDDILEEPPEKFLTSIAHYIATMGWGWCELESWGGALFAIVEGPPLGNAVSILSHFLAGAFSAASGMKLACVPVVHGEEHRFLFTDPTVVPEIEKWVDEGCSTKEIALRMHRGEHFSTSQIPRGTS